jgi:membrane-bound metal-dependent hydrolase YbcI (DUF457 family)
MPQNGLHAMAGMVARRWMPRQEWLMPGMVLGNMLPDLDNLAVAYATLTGAETHGLHRTFTHSIFTILTVLALFYLIAALTKNRNWSNAGLGLGIGVLMHILLDLALWFNGVELLWPIRYELNFWSRFTVPAWLSNILETAEFLAFGLYFLLLRSLAWRANTDTEHQASTGVWAYLELALFLIFTVLFFTAGAEGLPYMIFGALYLLSTIVAMVITIRMRKTVETAFS